MSRLTAPLPVRSTATLGGWRSDSTARHLPWLFGRVTLAPIPLDAAGREWLVADHAIAAIDAVSAEGETVEGWELAQRSDATGRVQAILRLSRPSAAPLTVRASGLRDAASGALIEHPAAILRHLAARAGLPTVGTDYAGLERDYPALALGWVLDSPLTLADAARQLLTPLGALWHGRTAARQAPAALPHAILRRRHLDPNGIAAEAHADGLTHRLDVHWGRDHASGQDRGIVRLAATGADLDAPALAWSAPMLRTARAALDVGRALLQDFARPAWRLTLPLTGYAPPLAIGDTVEIDHPWLPAGLAVIDSSERDLATGARTLAATLRTGNLPTIDMLGQAQAIDPARPEPQAVLYKDGVATIPITDDHGNPLPGATVTLDGLYSATANARGEVSFTTSRGPHTLTVHAAGYQPIELGITL